MGKRVSSISLWKRLLSYIYPIRLDSVTSDVSQNLEVYLIKDTLQLCTDRAVYSYEHKYENFNQLFKKFNFDKLKGNNVLLLGLGLGSVIQILDKCRKGLKYTAVEIDEEVIYLAEEFILKSLDVDIQLIHSDGLIFPQITEEKFDLICVDIFIDDWIPEDFLTKSFCSALFDILNEDGTVVFNTPAFSEKSSNSSLGFFNNHFLPIFTNGQLIHVHKNYMLLSNSYLLQGE